MIIVDVEGIPQRALLVIRWSAAVASLALIGPLLGCYSVQSSLLPWIPLVVVVYIGLVLALLRRSKVLVSVSSEFFDFLHAHSVTHAHTLLLVIFMITSENQ